MDNPFEEITQRLARIESLLYELYERGKIHQESDEDTLLNVQEAADFLNEAKTTIYSRTCKREIPFYKRGKKIYFKKKELVDWIEQGKKKTFNELINRRGV